ncbi:MAG: ABC transporter substrate-binding protein [Candidatus Eisenbacteria bacterium]|uniref:ABC transporter substrate-binding protein n=1 Tax=Eiseniibacteriota bacterium TaxID=2212470 RepID=A0A933SEF1_UNCEI|nr:ABC transporter substrate-binding protein [Candidatus Eisenbacteria bacterium]
MKLRQWLAPVAALALVVVALAGCGGKGGSGGGANEIVVGVYGSMTGNDATFGQSTKGGVEVALADLVEQAGGKIGGLPVRLVVEDDQGKAEEAATAAQKLINQDQVVALLGEVASSRSLAAAPICQAAGVPMISPSSTNPKVTQVGDRIFRMCFLDDFQGLTMARFAVQNLGLKKVAILKDVKSDYSVGLAQYFTDEFVKLGGTIVVEQAYTAGDQDFSAQLTAIKSKNPDAIFIPGYYTEVGLIARTARQQGLTVPLLGGDGWESEKLIEIGQDAINGAYYSNHWALDMPDTNLQAFLTKYHAKYNSDPDAIGGLAYDAARVLFAAMQKMAAEEPTVFAGLGSAKAGTPERKAALDRLRDLIAATRDYAGVTGSITLDANRNASKPAVVIEIKGGKKVYNTTIHP